MLLTNKYTNWSSNYRQCVGNAIAYTNTPLYWDLDVVGFIVHLDLDDQMVYLFVCV